MISPSSSFEKSLDISWKEGAAASVMVAVTDYYLIPLGLFLSATPSQIGLLVAIPNLLGSFSQLFASRIVSLFKGRLGFLVQGCFLQAALMAVTALLSFPLLPYRLEILIGTVAAFRILGNLIGTIWSSLASDYLPPDKRGDYFGWRSQVTGLAGVAGLVTAGILLASFKKISVALGFFAVFSLTALCRLISYFLMAKMQEAPLVHSKADDFTFFMFLRRFRESNFVRFVLYVSSITFTANLSAPYLNVYLLRDLHFGYLTYMLIHLAAVIGSLAAFPIWGRHADRFGNAKILNATSLLIPLIPVLWVISSDAAFLTLVQFFAGYVWSGFNLCSINFIYDAVSPAKRVRCLSYFSLINGSGVFLGASLGGYLAERLPPFHGNPLYTLFLLSALARLLSHFFLSRQFQEVRKTAQKISSLKLYFSVIGLQPLLGRDQEWNFFSWIRPSWKAGFKEPPPKS